VIEVDEKELIRRDYFVLGLSMLGRGERHNASRSREGRRDMAACRASPPAVA